MFLKDRLSAWMVEGSPAHLIHDAQAFVLRVNQSKLMRAAQRAELAPIVPL